MYSVYLGLEGFMLAVGYIIKELSLVHESGDVDHYLFAPPEKQNLTSSECTTIRYVSKNLNGLSYNEGRVSYTELDNILDNISGNFIKHLKP